MKLFEIKIWRQDNSTRYHRTQISHDDFIRAIKTHLVVTVELWDVEQTGVYIINDIPLITSSQFNKLLRLSFDNAQGVSLSIENNIEMIRFNNTSENDKWITQMTTNENVDITEINWKQFVAIMIDLYSHDIQDDFDE